MSLPASWSKRRPQDLFMSLWREAATWTSDRLSQSRLVPPDVLEALVESMIRAEDAGAATAALRHLSEGLWAAAFGSPAQRRPVRDGVVMSAMVAIDEVFLRVHPRTARLSGGPVRQPLPAWLVDAQETRTLTAVYAEDEHLRLVARGPLSRAARTVVDVNGDTLPDRFVALTAAPVATLLGDAQRLPITCLVVGQGAARGVPPAPVGKESVGFAPLAEVDEDYVYRCRTDEVDQTFLEIGVAVGSDLAARLQKAVDRLGRLDLLVAPELTLDDEASRAFASTLDPATAPRLSVAGSGPSDPGDEQGRRFNRSRAYNAFGAELWSHAKVWPYGMSDEQIETCRLFGVRDGTLLMEDIQAGPGLTVADLDGFGRVLVLICQDFQIRPGVADVVRTYQPDWVIVPIMDRGVGPGRWMHRTAFELSNLSPARFVVVSSLALADRSQAADYPDTPVALLVGPTTLAQVERDAGGVDRAVAVLACSEVDPRCGRAGWNDRSAAWNRTNLGIV